jgi:hypothetical protein
MTGGYRSAPHSSTARLQRHSASRVNRHASLFKISVEYVSDPRLDQQQLGQCLETVIWLIYPVEGAVPYHFNAFFVSSPVAAMFLCLNLAAGEASECVGKSDRSVNQAGHWHSRVHHRRSQSPQNTVEDHSIVVATARSDVVLRAGPGADFGAIGLVPRGTELETTDCIGGWYQVEFNGVAGFVGAADPGNDTAIRRPSARRAENRNLASPKHLGTNKIVSRERSQTKPPPATSGAANAERHDQLPGNGEKNEKPAPQLTDTERQALFDDFLKWYLTVRPNP